MKAKIFNSDGLVNQDKKNLEIRLFDGTQFFNNAGEDEKSFIERVSNEVKADSLEDIELSVVTLDALRKLKTPQLIETQKKELTSVYGEMLKVVLAERNIKPEKPKMKVVDQVAKDQSKAEAKAIKDKAREDARLVREETKAKAKEAKDKAKAEKDANKVVREKFLGHSDEAIAQAKAKVRYIISFEPFKVKESDRPEKVEGIILGIVTDKRSNQTFFRVHDKDKVLYYVTIHNTSIVFGEHKPKEDKTAEREAKAKEKAEAKEAKAKAKLEAQEAKDKAKLEAQEAKAKAKAEKDKAKGEKEATAQKTTKAEAKVKAPIKVAKIEAGIGSGVETPTPTKGKGFSRSGTTK